VRRSYRQDLSPEDREVRDRLDRASRELEGALRVLDSVRGGPALRTRREVTALYRGLQEVGKARPMSSDPDLIPESERNRQFRERIAERRVERKPPRDKGVK